MLEAIAIDDEPIALEVIKSLSQYVPFMKVSAYFTSGFEAMRYLQKNKVNLIFLDVHMPDLSGIDFLKTISSPPMVIFTTAHSQHAVEGFELDAVDFLLKPFSLTRFLKACNKADNLIETAIIDNKITDATYKPIFIKSGSDHIPVELDDILYAESIGNYVKFALSGRHIVSRLTMKEVQFILPPSLFMRIHRSFFVSKKHITKIDKRSVWQKDHEFPIGSAFINEIEGLINSHNDRL